MKKIRYILLMSVLLLMSGCSLDTEPTASVGQTSVFSTTESAYIGLNGVGKLMVKQYLKSQGYNGEGTIKLYYGEYMGNSMVKDVTGFDNTQNMMMYGQINNKLNYYPWYYYYRIIGDVNVIIDDVDDVEGLAEDKLEIKARALTYRAYAYFMLSQIYCNRWSDSHGAGDGLVLRLSSTTPDDMAISTHAETYTAIYNDLDDAIAAFKKSGIKRKNYFDLSIDVAYAVYAKAALTREDFETAAQMAKLARTDYPLMNNSELMGGFFSSNNEWIWGSYGSVDQTLHYYAYQSYMAYNSNSTHVRSYPGCITKELAAKIPITDIRREWWYIPEKSTEVIQEITDKNIVKELRTKHPDLDSKAKLFNYMQFKVACEIGPGTGCLNHIRSSEMYLIEAEALLRQNKGRDAEAQKVLIALNKGSGRDPNYATSLTGKALLEEIWFYRKIELWGEGLDWFDLKRNGLVRERSDRANGGSYRTAVAVDITPADRNNWTYKIPAFEYDYNKLIDKQ